MTFDARPILIPTLGALAVAAVSFVPAAAQSANGAADPQTWTAAAQGNEARYRVREQLARINFPSDAVGVTSDVRGTLALGADGSVVAAESRFTIGLGSLKSDADRRDNYLRRRTLLTDTFPTAVFVPESLDGLSAPLADGTHTFRMTGRMTIRDQTRPVTWDVTANVAGDVVTGQAKTSFTFDDFALTKPRVGSVLSVEDEIRLEYDFRLVRSNR